MTMLNAKRSHANQEVYDAVVIGSGMAGLSTAALLSKAGKRVLVLEQNSIAGGSTRTISKNGYEWSVGVQYIAEMHDPTSRYRWLMDYITDKGVEWKKMDDAYDRIVFEDGGEFRFLAGKERFQNSLYNAFPASRSQLDEYFGLLRPVNDAAAFFFGKRALNPLLAKSFDFLGAESYSRYAGMSTMTALRSIFTDERLISVLTSQWGDIALPPSKSSFVMHMTSIDHYMEGASFPVGGPAQISKSISAVIDRAGGAVLTSTPVERIVIEKGKACGVRLADGREIRSHIVVSAAGAQNTFLKLIKEDTPKIAAVRKSIAGLKPSMGYLTLRVGFNAGQEELKLPACSYWVVPNGNYDESYNRYMSEASGDIVNHYLTFPSAKDPLWPRRHPTKSTAVMLGMVDSGKSQNWQERYCDEMFEKLYRCVPQVRGKVDWFELADPVQTAKESGWACGEIYGLEMSPERFLNRELKTKSCVKNLYMAGQDIVAPGIGGALSSGALAAIEILGILQCPYMLRFFPQVEKILSYSKKVPLMSKLTGSGAWA